MSKRWLSRWTASGPDNVLRFQRVRWIPKPHFLWEGIGVEPINQTFAPTRDDPGLWVMDMRVDKPGQNKLFTVLRHLRVWMCGLQRGRIAYGFNLSRHGSRHHRSC